MTELPEDDARETVILPGSESAGFGAAPTFSFVPQPGPEPPLFHSYAQPPVRRFERIPNYGHLLLLVLLITVAFSILIVILGLVSHFHLFGLRLSQKSATDLGFNLASEVILYLVTFGLSLFVFPMVWNESLFAGLQWRDRAALSKFGRLAAIALGCFGLALFDQVLMPGPANSPIEKMLSSPEAAWLMFAFGVTMAPFFEEMFFRGFLLPAMCTVADWTDESLFGRPQLKINQQMSAVLSAIAMVLVCFVSLAVPSAIAYSFYEMGTSTGKNPIALLSAAIAVGSVVYGGLHLVRSNTADQHVRPLDANGHPQWSLPAMIIGSVLTSIPFAGMHVEQQGHSLGPFLLLIVVSLILCAVRLRFRSLAASTLVHASYNFFIFSLTLAATGGFRHFDKM